MLKSIKIIKDAKAISSWEVASVDPKTLAQNETSVVKCWWYI